MKASLIRKWHRVLSLILLAQLIIWMSTALGMTLVPRKWTTAYKVPTYPTSFKANNLFPNLNLLKNKLDDTATKVILKQEGLRSILRISSLSDEEKLLASDLNDLRPPGKQEIADWASQITSAKIQVSNISIQEKNSPEYQKLPLPVYRVEAPNAILFFDMQTGKYISQTTPAKKFENLMKTIHVMDYTGNAQFRANRFLTAAAILFLLTAFLGILSVQKLRLNLPSAKIRSKTRVYRWHKWLGIVLVIQVILWTSSGLSVVWLLEPARNLGNESLEVQQSSIDWSKVKVHPDSIVQNSNDSLLAPVEIELVMLLDKPVYRFNYPGRNSDRKLIDANTGNLIHLQESDRDAIAANYLKEETLSSVSHWEKTEKIDFHFYTGPFPVWKAYFSVPYKGVLSVDCVTGLVHQPVRTNRLIFLEKYYNVHVVNWSFGVIKYRLEPELLTVIGLLFILILSGIILQLKRRKKPN